MKKKIVCLLLIVLVLVLAVFAVIRINRKDDVRLKKVTVADATITSLTVAIA